MLDFGLLRDLDADYLQGERDVMRALADDDPQRVHDGLSSLGYLQDPQSFDRDRCSSTSRARATGCSPKASAGSTPHTSPKSWSSATRRAHRTSR
jgi:predicted unusual protein kinase regulating ubiquinone biosynthesis (AarF/ABC1/UbiB family)